MSHDWYTQEDSEHSDVEAEAFEVHVPYKIAKQNRLRHRTDTSSPRPARQRDESPAPRPAAKRQRPNTPEVFRCRHCRMMVGLVPSGGKHRNHCPYCLHSRHVDLQTPGDRLSPCGGTMAPIGVFTQSNGEVSLIHRCLACGVERRNRIAADDDYDLVMALPDVTHWMPAQQLAAAAEDESST